MALTTILMGIVLSPTLLMGESAARAVGRFWASVVLAELKIICGVDARYVSDARLPKGPAIVAANHQSMWETLFLFARLEKPAVIFKKELAQVPVFGWWLVRSGSIVVDRKAGVKALRSMTEAAEARLAEGAQIVIFPEGTRTAPGETARLQPGVAALYKKSTAPVVAVGHDSGRFWLHPDIAKKPGIISVSVAPPIEPGLPKGEFLDRLTTALRTARADLQPANDETSSSTSRRDPPGESQPFAQSGGAA